MQKLLFFFAFLSLAALSSRAAEPKPEPPPQVAALKAAGINVNPAKGGGWNVEVRAITDLTEDVWHQAESLPEVVRFSAGEGFTDTDLARLSKIKSIQSIYFNGPLITDAGLSAPNNMPNLESFSVDHSTKITGSGLPSLKDAPKLTALGFGGCIIDDRGATDLAQLTHLKQVKLGHVRITRKTLPRLAALADLEKLEITPNWDPAYYTAADFAALAPAANLRELEIHDMVLPWDNGLDHLTALKSLKTLNLFWCYTTEADLAKFKAAMPNVKLDVRNPAGVERLDKFNERVRQVQKEAAAKNAAATVLK